MNRNFLLTLASGAGSSKTVVRSRTAALVSVLMLLAGCQTASVTKDQSRLEIPQGIDADWMPTQLDIYQGIDEFTQRTQVNCYDGYIGYYAITETDIWWFIKDHNGVGMDAISRKGVILRNDEQTITYRPIKRRGETPSETGEATPQAPDGTISKHGDTITYRRPMIPEIDWWSEIQLKLVVVSPQLRDRIANAIRREQQQISDGVKD